MKITLNRIIHFTIRRLTKVAKYFRYIFRKISQIGKIGRFEKPYKLNLGCGKARLNGWINIDLNNCNEIDLIWDVTDRLPFDEETCDLIYNEHLLEHLSVEEGISFLHECHRVLKKGGVLRIAMPSLDELIKNSYLNTWQDEDWLSWPQNRFIKTRAEMINIAFRWWGHKWLYDREELYRRLHEAGFDNIIDCEWGQSNLPLLNGLETRKDSKLICEAMK